MTPSAPSVPFSCDADPTDLDNPVAKLRTREQLLVLLETEDNDTLWFNYGIVPDFLVSYVTTRFRMGADY